uniref:VWFC domain-containing protein n=1 Tax=Ciona savignyi TaxID=51511 RepID=H2YYT5_CIOSA
DGVQFQPNSCERCMCDSGSVSCTSENSQCCPTCQDCSLNGRVYRNGQNFMNDTCSQCSCANNDVKCSEPRCPEVNCPNPIQHSAQCCPQCSYHGTIYRDRETFTSSRDPCQQCVCQRGSVTCTRVTCPPVSCLDQHRPPGQCCPQCPGCTDGLEQWTTGSSWQQRGNPCMTCTCKDGDIRCSRRVCPDVTCDNPATMADQCCPTCARCAYHGVVYGDGETVVAQDACQQCTCSAGEVSCRRMECPSVQCTHAGRRAGECCATCDGCDYERRNYRNGERFTPVGSSACISCICQDGGVQCTSIDCPQITCHNPTNLPGQCCPVLCSHDGEEYEYGEIWYADSCTTCACDGGKVDCTSPTCPTAPCSHPAKLSGSCCRTCEMCELDGHTYSSTTTFPHPTEPCRICQCQDGNVACRSRPCPALSCTSPIHEDGTCCPSCPTSCTVGTSQVEEGDSAPHPTNPCLTCSCQDGNLNCTERCNSSPECSHPTDGRCCRDNCDGCHYRGRSHDNGEVFAHHRDKCRSCSCINGNVRCRLGQCRALSCSNPVHPAGDCCPRCPDTQCIHNDREYADQERFVDGCRQCRCASGSVTCKPISCDPTTCTHPVKDGCCRSCTGCRINHVDYQNGDVVPDSSSNACEVCRCLNGNLVCRARTCPVPSCSHPTMKGCCPACEGKSYG